MKHGDEAGTPANPAAALDELMRAQDGKSLTARIRELLPEIEAAHRAGYSHARILGVLNDSGLRLSRGTYDKLLHRARANTKPRTESPGPQAPRTPPHELHDSPPDANPSAPCQGSLWRILTSAPEGYDPDV